MSKSEVVATESAALNGEAAAASGADASEDRNSIVAVRARLMDGLPELGEVLRLVLEGTPVTTVPVIKCLSNSIVSRMLPLSTAYTWILRCTQWKRKKEWKVGRSLCIPRMLRGSRYMVLHSDYMKAWFEEA